MPTEAEWNYAAAGGAETRTYPWGVEPPEADAELAAYGCFFGGTGECSGVGNIAPVGSVPAGNGRWGQADLAGNLWEWALDLRNDGYQPLDCTDCANHVDPDAKNLRVDRGGAFLDEPKQLLSKTRSGDAPDTRSHFIGARCARNL